MRTPWILLVFLLAFSTQHARAQAPAAAASSTFTMRVVSDIPSFDWTTVAGDDEDLVFKNIMEGLTELGPDGKARGRLAETITVSPDGLTYTFRLRAGVKWSDGRELVANDFIESWKKLLAPSSVSPDADQLDLIKGAFDYRHGKLADFSKTGVAAPDPHTLVVTLARPSSGFLQFVALTSAFPIRADLLKKFGAKEAFEPANLVVLGPYLVAEHVPNQSLKLKRNPAYSGPAPQVAQVTLSIVADDGIALQLFKDGKLDALWTTSSLEAAAPKTGAQQGSIRGADIVYLGLDTTDYPLNLPAVRRAIVRAIDRSKLAAALQGPIDPSDSLLPAPLFPDSTLAAPAFDPAAARKLWQDAGLQAVAPPNIELLAPEGPMTRLAAEFVKSQLEANLGVRIDLRVAGALDYEQRLTTLLGSLFILSRRATTLDPQEVLDDFVSDSRDNHLHWKNATYDALVAQTAKLPAGPQRAELHKRQLELLQSTDAIIVPLYVPRVAWQLSARFTGFTPNIFGEVFFRDLRAK